MGDRGTREDWVVTALFVLVMLVLSLVGWWMSL